VSGEDSAHAGTWSVIAKAHAALNRHELPPMTSDCIDMDHRGVTSRASGDLTGDIGAVWDLTPNITYYVEAIHRLSNSGAVVSHAAFGNSQAGFEAECRGLDVLTVEDDLVSRCELYDEDDLDAALARFDQLSG
jgi:hypothetical protein